MIFFISFFYVLIFIFLFNRNLETKPIIHVIISSAANTQQQKKLYPKSKKAITKIIPTNMFGNNIIMTIPTATKNSANPITLLIMASDYIFVDISYADCLSTIPACTKQSPIFIFLLHPGYLKHLLLSSFSLFLNPNGLPHLESNLEFLSSYPDS